MATEIVGPTIGCGFSNGVLSGTTSTVSLAGATMPGTVTLNSSDATRKIEFSSNGGVEYFTPTYDANSTTRLVVSFAAPLTHVKFTGVTNDTWRIL